MPDITSVPSPTFGLTGFIVPAESAILAGVQADMNAAFGGNLNQALETPQGQLASSMAALVGETNNIFLKYTQQTDPAYAEGRMQDAIARIYFIERNAAQPTVASVLVTGLSGVVIPTGALAVATDGNLYAATGSIAIPAGGSITGAFACVTNGPVACPAHSLNKIYQAIPGWDTIDNPANGVLGNDVESRADFEFKRQQSVFLNSSGTVPAIRGAVLQVPNVLDAYVADNASSGTVSIGGVLLAPNSIYVSVVGGDQQAVARAIWSRKAPGCGYNGNTTQIVYDNSPGLSLPYPGYAVTFEIPSSLPILFSVVIANSAGVPSNAATLIQNAIIAAFAGADGGSRARIASTIFASRFYSSIAALGSWAQIVSLLLGTSTPTLTSVVVGINKVPTVSALNISVSIV